LVIGSEKTYKRLKSNVSKSKKLLVTLLDLSRLGLWYRKVEKCNIKIKKIKPTPRSITHKNPINTSASSMSK
jgi:hypothetical protein